MKYFNSLIIVSLFFCIACKREKIIQFPVFKKETSLKSQVIFEKDTNFYDIANIVFSKEYMILERIRSSPKFLVYDKDNNKFIKGYGAIGKGPNEFLGPEQQVITSNGNLLAWITDFYKNDLVLLNISSDSTLSERDIKILKRLKFPENISYLKQSFVTKDSILVGGLSDLSRYGRFVSYDLASKKVRFFGELPDVRRNSRLKETLYGFVSAIRPDQSKYAVAMHYFNRIEIYDSQGRMLNTIGESFDRARKISNKDIEKENLTDYYTDIIATNQYIFALKLDALEKNFAEEKEVYVEVFDWDGNPVHRFILQEYAQGIAYDEDSKDIYSINHWTHGNIHKYDISHILK